MATTRTSGWSGGGASDFVAMPTVVVRSWQTRIHGILDAARAVSNDNPLVFPSGRGKRLNDMALSGLLKTLEIPAVPHGFRSTFRDWAAEETNHPREVVEAALAHVVQNKGGGRLRAVGPVRTAAAVDERLGVCHRDEVTHYI